MNIVYNPTPAFRLHTELLLNNIYELIDTHNIVDFYQQLRDI